MDAMDPHEIGPVLQGRIWTTYLRPLAVDLLTRVDGLADGVTDEIHEAVPEIGDYPELAQETRASAAANLALALTMIRDGVESESVEPPPAALVQARHYVRASGDLTALLRTYRIGHASFWTVWTEGLRERITDAAELADAVTQSSQFMFGYVDAVSSRIVDVFSAERERWVRSAAALRADTVRAILAGAAVDTATATRRLRYDLAGDHVAFIVWSDPTENDVYAVLEERAARVAAALGARASLLVSIGSLAVAGWIPARALPAMRVAASLADGERGGASIRAAVGAPGVGVEGFRASHVQAQHARRVADLTGLPPGRIQYFTDIALAALATVDPQLATWFVRRELGTLAEHTDSADRISSTLAAYLDENASHARAARRLGVHENTVAYRVRQAETMIGHPVDERRLELGVALHLRNVVGPPNPG